MQVAFRRKARRGNEIQPRRLSIKRYKQRVTNVRKFELSLAISAAMGGAGLLLGLNTHAQTVAQAGAAADDVSITEVVVTARKRDETLHEVPLAISVFSSENLEAFGASTLEDIAARTPGFQYVPQGGQRPGRVHTALRFRGMDINSSSATQQLATMFIDGIPVANGLGGVGLEDIERVEVIKGPQSAFFGRSTFGGAVNYITKNPSSSEYQGLCGLRISGGDEHCVEAPCFVAAASESRRLSPYRAGFRRWAVPSGKNRAEYSGGT